MDIYSCLMHTSRPIMGVEKEKVKYTHKQTIKPIFHQADNTIHFALGTFQIFFSLTKI